MIWKQGWKSYKQKSSTFGWINDTYETCPQSWGLPKISHFPIQNQEGLGGCLLAFAQDLSNFATMVGVVCDFGHGNRELRLCIMQAWGKVSLSVFFWWKNIAPSKCRKNTGCSNKHGWKNTNCITNPQNQRLVRCYPTSQKVCFEMLPLPVTVANEGSG